MPSPVAQAVVAIVGRPNVGKSTLFNRILGQRKAIVEREPGVTRDRNYGEGEWKGVSFLLVDTGGLLSPHEDPLSAQVEAQTEVAASEADLVILLVDAREGLQPADELIVRSLRASEAKVLLAVNKVDTASQEELSAEFYRLGLEPLFSVSAEHGRGVGDLLDAVVERLPLRESTPYPEEVVRVAVVGRPNVGKSSLVNRLLGEERAVVAPEPGTTRDPIDSFLRVGDRDYVIIDTAGLRRRSRMGRKLESVSALMAMRGLARADVALLLLDATQGVTSGDAAIGGHIVEAGAGCVILLNKWDAVDKEEKTLLQRTELLRERMRHLAFAPVLSCSALTGQRLGRIFPLVDRVAEARKLRVPTSELNRELHGWLSSHPPPTYRGQPVKVFYLTQVGIRPPRFVCFVSRPEGIHSSWQRFLLNKIREAWGFEGTPLRVEFRRGR